MTRKLAESLLSPLHLDPLEVTSLIQRLPEKQTRKKIPKRGGASYQTLSASTFDAIADWWNFAVLALVQGGQCRATPSELSNRLGISEFRARKAVQLLIELGLLKKVKNTLVPTGAHFTTGNDIPSSAIRRNHSQGLELARAALHQQNVGEREFGAITFCGDPARLDEAKAILREARRKIADLMESGQKSTVYRLQIQMFKLSKEPREK